jgi:DNA-binding NtrC family response regulator
VPIALLVDDDPESLRALADLVQRAGFEAYTAATLGSARDALVDPVPDLVVIDLHLPDGTGLELVDDLRDHPDTEVVVVTGQGSINTAVEAIRNGAVDYLTKPIDFARLRKILGNVQRSVELRQEVDTLRTELRNLGRFGAFVGGSPAMQRVYDQIERVAPTDSTVLVTGETGTGKELAARTVHQLSRRSRQPFLPINCGAVPPNLIESEIFGHERGSFTGAAARHAGMFERADGGTLFLDEVTEMPIELQVKLLRIIETGEVLRVGGTRPLKVDVRVVAASNRSLDQAVAEHRLREDLLYRLMVFPIRLPPLRERTTDIDLLANGFLAELNSASPHQKNFATETLDLMRRHPWPGNVRELRNVVERAFILATDEIGPEFLPFQDLPTLGDDDGDSLTFEIGTSIDETERRLILATLAHHEGDKRKTAAVLGVSLKTLYNRLKQYETENEELNVKTPAG